MGMYACVLIYVLHLSMLPICKTKFFFGGLYTIRVNKDFNMHVKVAVKNLV